jgi:hypothetical protein
MRLGCVLSLSGWFLAQANMGSLGDDSLLADGMVSHKLVRERIQEELAKLEEAKSGHASTHETALDKFAKLHGANDINHFKTMDSEDLSHARLELSKLENLDHHDHFQMKLNNDEARARVMEEIAKIESMHEGRAMAEDSKEAHASHAQELAKLDIKQQIFDSKAGHEEARKRVMGELAKLEALHSHDTHKRVAVKGLNTKTGVAAKGLNLKKDAPPALQQDSAPKRSAWGGLKSVLGMKIAEQAVAEDSVEPAAVNLVQTGTSLLSNKRKKHQEL